MVPFALSCAIPQFSVRNNPGGSYGQGILDHLLSLNF